MEFRFDFFFRVFMDTIFYIINIAGTKIIFQHTPKLGAWTEAETCFFLGIYFIVDALHMVIFSTNMWLFPAAINRGDLDYHLVRPVSPLFMVTTRDFSLNSTLNLGMAIAYAWYAMEQLPRSISSIDVFWGIALVLNGVLIFTAIQLIFLLPVFWTHSARGLSSIFYNLTRFFEKPDGIYTGWMRRLITTILPLMLIASFPARIFIEGASATIILHTIVASVFLYVLTAFLWNRSLANYSSASS